VPAAPLPSALTTAKTLFIGNAGDQENADCLRAYNDFYDGIASLTRFHLVSDPNQADLILEIHYEINLGAAAVTNDSHSLRQFRVVLIDPHSHVILWTLDGTDDLRIKTKSNGDQKPRSTPYPRLSVKSTGRLFKSSLHWCQSVSSQPFKVKRSQI
jgi:hypothetical protein